MDIKTHLLTWLHSPQHAAYAALGALVVLDVICAHSKNPRINHLTSALALLISKVLTVTGIASIPAVGPALVAILNAIIGPNVVADAVTGAAVVTNVVPPAAKPDAPPPPAA